MKLTDNQTHDLLHQAAELLAKGNGETVRAETALRAGEKMLYLLQLGLVGAMETGGNDPTRPPEISPGQRPDQH